MKKKLTTFIFLCICVVSLTSCLHPKFQVGSFEDIGLSANDYVFSEELSLVERLKNTKIEPIEYFLYQLYFNTYLHNNQNKVKPFYSLFMHKYDKTKKNVLLEFRSIFDKVSKNNETSNEEFALAKGYQLIRKLGLNTTEKGLIQEIIYKSKLPTNFYKDPKYINCIELELLINIKDQSFSVYLNCNNELSVKRHEKVTTN